LFCAAPCGAAQFSAFAIVENRIAMPALAERLNRVSISASVIMTIKARELAAQGIKVISLASGEPDFPSPPHAIEAAHQAALAGDTKYPPQDGTRRLKEAVQRKFKRDNNLDYALDEIMVTNGGKQSIFNAFMATIDPGDEVLIPAPFWISYAEMAKVAGGVPVTINCPQNNGFKLRPEDLDAAITPKTKWVMINFPNNPTGAACSRDEMKAIAAVLMKHPHVWVMTDDMYEHLVYDGFEFCTIADVEPRLKDRTLTVNGASKTYAMTGWRIGFCGGPKALIKGMMNMQGQATAGVSTISQAAVAAALDGPQDLVRERAEEYRQRRDLVVEMLNAAPGISCHKPEGAFYVFPNIAGCIGKTSKGGRKIETDTDFAMALLEEKYVATVQGTAYGMSPYLRISYATNTDNLREACGRIQEFCRELS
jgi:aspartate aminotransferase